MFGQEPGDLYRLRAQSSSESPNDVHISGF